MNAHDVLKNYREQTFAATVLFVAVALFGLVFWKMLASPHPYILEVEQNALETRSSHQGAAVALWP